MGSTEIHGVKSMLCPSIVINEIIALSTLSESFESAKENIGKNFFEKMTSFHWLGNWELLHRHIIVLKQLVSTVTLTLYVVVVLSLDYSSLFISPKLNN